MGQKNSGKAARGRLLTALMAAAMVAMAASVSAEQRIDLDSWQTKKLGDWNEKSFDGETDYQASNSGEYLSARAENGASALFLKREIDVTKTPVLNWRWRAKEFNGAKDHLVKEEDDFPARIYVVVKNGFLPWDTLAINYVWAGGDIDKTSWPNPFTEKAIMVPVVKGEQGRGEWRQEKVNVVEDFKRLFNKDISRIAGVAIMTDADNHGGVSAADYGGIWFSDL